MTRRHQLFFVFLLVGSIGLIVSFSLYRKQSSPNNNSDALLESSSEETSSGAFTDSSIRSSRQSSSQSPSSSWSRVGSGNALEEYPSIPASKEKRIIDLYAGMAGDYHFDGPHPKEIEILTEGMDTLSAAKYLKALVHFDYALEYAEKALADNSDSFEALLLRTQLLPSDREAEREAGFRELLEMEPNSVEALVGFGGIFSSHQPSEAIQYFQKAIKIDPLYKKGAAYVGLGTSYERLGQYDKALKALRKAFQIYPGDATGAHIRAIEEGNPIIKPIQPEPQRQLPEEPPPEETSPEMPLQDEAPSTPDKAERLPRETESVDKPMMEADESENKDKNAKYQQMLDDRQRMIDEGQEKIYKESTPSFVGDERVRRESEADRNKRSHSRERHDEDESDQK